MTRNSIPMTVSDYTTDVDFSVCEHRRKTEPWSGSYELQQNATIVYVEATGLTVQARRKGMKTLLKQSVSCVSSFRKAFGLRRNLEAHESRCSTSFDTWGQNQLCLGAHSRPMGPNRNMA